MSNTAEVIELKEGTEIVAYDDIRQKVAEVKEACDFIPNVSDDDGYQKSKRVSLDVGKILTTLESKRKDLKADSLAYGRMLDSEAKLISIELEGFQLPHKEAYKELDQLKKQREIDRKAKLEERIADMRGLPDAMRDSDAEGVRMALDSLQQNECLDFYECTQDALLARNKSVEALSVMYTDKLKSERDAIELAKLKKEAAEREQAERESRIAAEAKADAELAERAAKAEAEAAVKREELAKILAQEAAEKAEIDRVAAIKQAEELHAAKILEVEAKAMREAEAKESARLAEVKAEADAKAKREANTRHKGKINSAAVAELFQRCKLSPEQAKAVVTAIAKNEIPSVSINY
jgi:colicin import membrane protein